jgi:hypothetical protein
MRESYPHHVSPEVLRTMAAWPDPLVKAVLDKIDAFWKASQDWDYENVDMERICRKDDPASLNAFQAIDADGCCGSEEVKWIIDGITILYGFNYGH